MSRPPQTPPEGGGFPDLYREVMCSVRDMVGGLLAHFSTVQPRNEDLPIAFNEVANGANAVSEVATVANGATLVRRIQPRPGHTLHVSSLSIKPTDPTLDPGDFPVEVRLTGRILQRTHEAIHRRPPMLDRDDVLEIRVTNNSGADATVAYHVDGWLRRNVERL